MEYKNSTRSALRKLYHEHGIEITLRVAESALRNKKFNYDKNFYIDFHGEIAETVLECMLEDWMKKHPMETKDWVLTKGLILKDIDNLKSKFSTEIDLAVFTPNCIYLFECKSYSGSNILVGNGMIRKQDGTEFNAYKQSKLHHDILLKFVQNYLTEQGEVKIKLVLFNFSTGKFIDRRNRIAKGKMILCDKDNVLKVFKDNNKKENWKIKELKVVVNRLQKASVKARSAHIQYVKGLHGGD